MSSFLIVHVDRHRRKLLNRWIQQHAGKNEVVWQSLANGWSRCTVAPDVTRSLTTDGYFRGTAISNRAISYRKPNRLGTAWGSFLNADFLGDQTVITRDVYGHTRLMTSSGQGFSAASDSLLVLAAMRRALGAVLTPDPAALRARTILHLTTAQTMGPATHFQEIAAIHAGRVVALGPGSVELRENQVLSLTESAEDYIAAVRDAAGQLRGLMSALDQIPDATLELSMSGGLDSRIVAAAGRAANADLILTSAKATPAQQRDYEVAASVATEHGFPFGRTEAPQPTQNADRMLAYFGVYNAGTYDRLGGMRPSLYHPGTIHLSGLGIGPAKGAFGWQRWSDLVRTATAKDSHSTIATRSAFLRAGNQTILSGDGDPDAGDASEFFYLLYRSGIHSGATFAASSWTYVNPLASPAVTSAGRAVRSDQIAHDLTLLLAPEMSQTEYDVPGRGLAREEAEQRLLELGGQLSHGHEIEVVGNPSDVPIGTTELGLSVAESLGFERGPLERALDWFDEDIERLPRSLRKQYRKVYDNGLWMRRKTGGNVAGAGPSVAKAAALRVFAALD